jgi:hypothetical protein
MESYYQSITICNPKTKNVTSLGDPWPVRRRSRRIRVDQTVRFRTMDSPVSIIGAVKNLSLGGAFIDAPLIPRRGALLAFGFVVEHLGKRVVLRSMGRVAWTSRASGRRGFGLRFIEPEREMLACISALIRDRHVSAGL